MVAIVDYGVGNLGSIRNMFKRIGIDACVTRNPVEISAASRLILPGVGAFDAAMTKLSESGLIDVLNREVLERGKPILGICLGMQLLANRSEEGRLPGLGWISAEVRSFVGVMPDTTLKIPHMGWSDTVSICGHPLFSGLESESRFYYVHSYFLDAGSDAGRIAEADYGIPFTAAVAQQNIFGVQFHPEKSHRFGMTLLGNFVNHC